MYVYYNSKTRVKSKSRDRKSIVLEPPQGSPTTPRLPDQLAMILTKANELSDLVKEIDPVPENSLNSQGGYKIS